MFDLKPNRYNNNTLKIYDPWEEFRAREAAREARRAARSANSSDNTLDSLLTLGIIIGGAYMLGNAGSFNTYNSGNSNLGTSLGIIGYQIPINQDITRRVFITQ